MLAFRFLFFTDGKHCRECSPINQLTKVKSCSVSLNGKKEKKRDLEVTPF